MNSIPTVISVKASVSLLPGAASAPVLNPVRRGRYPAGVVGIQKYRLRKRVAAEYAEKQPLGSASPRPPIQMQFTAELGLKLADLFVINPALHKAFIDGYMSADRDIAAGRARK